MVIMALENANTINRDDRWVNEPADCSQRSRSDVRVLGTRPLVLADRWTVEVYQDWVLPDAVVDAWNLLAKSQGSWGVFVSRGWFQAWHAAFGRDDDLRIFVLRKTGVIKAIVPCRAVTAGTSGKRRGLASLTNDHTCHYDLLVDPASHHEAAPQIIATLQHFADGGGILFDHLPAAGDNVHSLIDAFRHAWVPVHVESAPCSPWLETAGDWQECVGRLPGRLRNTLRRCQKKAMEKGQLRFEMVRQGAQVQPALDAIFETEYRSWKGREGTAIKSDPSVERFYRQLADWAAATNHLLLFLLRLDDRPIAGSYCLIDGATVFLLKPGFDESFGSLSPGTLLQAEILKYLFDEPDIQLYNFLGAPDGWKMEWTSTTCNTSSITAYPRGMKGWSSYLVQHGWKNFLKRSTLVKRSYALIKRP
jgi:CelD/BcsL family acetyltransferase involved in cellulose biosynthesis